MITTEYASKAKLSEKISSPLEILPNLDSGSSLFEYRALIQLMALLVKFFDHAQHSPDGIIFHCKVKPEIAVSVLEEALKTIERAFSLTISIRIEGDRLVCFQFS